jgi:hypothetical protein
VDLVAVGLGERVGVRVLEGVGVGAEVLVEVEVGVRVWVAVEVDVKVAVSVGVALAVTVGVSVGVGVSEGVGDGMTVSVGPGGGAVGGENVPDGVPTAMVGGSWLGWKSCRARSSATWRAVSRSTGGRVLPRAASLRTTRPVKLRMHTPRAKLAPRRIALQSDPADERRPLGRVLALTLATSSICLLSVPSAGCGHRRHVPGASPPACGRRMPGALGLAIPLPRPYGRRSQDHRAVSAAGARFPAWLAAGHFEILIVAGERLKRLP